MPVVATGGFKILRTTVAGVALLAWFSISNHCALATVESTIGTGIHLACHGNGSAPAKPAGHPDTTPCCKILRATLLNLSKSAPAYDPSLLLLDPYFVGSVALPSETVANLPLELDTGPPFARSITELIFQRSILAHAPPLS